MKCDGGALRRQAIALHLPIERFSPKASIDRMYSSGELSFEEFDVLKAIRVKRNRVAHGVVTELSDRELKELLELTRSFVTHWGEKSSVSSGGRAIASSKKSQFLHLTFVLF
ncbi:MAG: hypothetical protein AAGB13_11205 [Cyanobacteria bacterium P01_F01_bin.33]